jgi:anaerobic selenocysteine-containing dehydrogenase
MAENQSSNLWRPTACNLCYINCGIEVVTEGRRLTKIRGDKKHPDTKGYSCQKAHRLDYYQNQADRLTSPLRRRGDGSLHAEVFRRRAGAGLQLPARAARGV